MAGVTRSLSRFPRGRGRRAGLPFGPLQATQVSPGQPEARPGQQRQIPTPWDGVILCFTTTWGLQSSGDRVFLLFQVFSSRSWSAQVPGLYQTEHSSTSQEFPLLSTHGDTAGMFCPVWGPRCKRENEEAEVAPRLLSSAG